MNKHRTFIFVLLFLLASVPVIVSADGQRGIVPVPIKDKSGNQVLLYQESHALLVGVSEYTEGWPNLPGVRGDISKVKEALEQKGFHTVVAINPTRVELRDSIENFINLYGQDIDNRLIFYFAGHGHTMKSSYGEEMGYFVPADAPNPNIDKSGFLATSINMESIEVYSKKVQSKHALFLFDSCFSGSIFALSRAIPENISFKTSKPVRQFITAGSANETVPDESIFNDQLIRALNGEGDLDGDGYVTGVELGEFLNKTVINYSKGSQHPQYGKIRNPNLDKGDFVFSLLNIEHIEQSADSIVEERKKLEQDRLRLEEERKRVAALQLLNEEKRKLEEEKRKFKEAQDKLARLQPPAATSGTPKGMVKIPGGEYTAGLDADIAFAECNKYLDNCKRSWFTDETPHGETVRSFNMDKYEVTQAEYERVMGENPSNFKGKNLPVERVTWHEAKAYCERVGKRLPTEWEWEKAAKGGRDTIYPWGDEFDGSKANFCDRNCKFDWKAGQFDDGYKNTAPVGSYPPNGYGLHDMAGNVWEWTASDYDGSGTRKVLRGGSWYDFPYGMRSAYRGRIGPSGRDDILGFRCAQ